MLPVERECGRFPDLRRQRDSLALRRRAEMIGAETPSAISPAKIDRNGLNLCIDSSNKKLSECMVTAIDVQNLAGDVLGCIAGEKSREIADVADCNRGTPGEALVCLCDRLVKIFQSCGGTGGNGRGGDRVDANAPGAEFDREVADDALQRGLRRAHDIVVFDATLCPRKLSVISDPPAGMSGSASLAMSGKNDRRLPLRLEIPEASNRRGGLRDLPSCKHDIVEEKIELAPVRADLIEDAFELPFRADIARKDDRAAEGFGQRANVWLGFGVDVSDRQIRPAAAEGDRAAIRDGLVVGDANDETLFAGEIEDGCQGCAPSYLAAGGID